MGLLERRELDPSNWLPRNQRQRSQLPRRLQRSLLPRNQLPRSLRQLRSQLPRNQRQQRNQLPRSQQLRNLPQRNQPRKLLQRRSKDTEFISLINGLYQGPPLI